MTIINQSVVKKDSVRPKKSYNIFLSTCNGNNKINSLKYNFSLTVHSHTVTTFQIFL